MARARDKVKSRRKREAPLTLQVEVPYRDAPLAAIGRDRVRALKRHLIEALRDLRSAKKPEKLIQKETVPPTGFAAAVTAAGCTHCQGFCCRNGGNEAYIDVRTMARVRKAHPDLDAAGILRLYTSVVPQQAVTESCIFHGERGCTLARSLRAELCNSYWCTGLQDYLNYSDGRSRVVIVATRNGVGQKSPVLYPPPVPDDGET